MRGSGALRAGISVRVCGCHMGTAVCCLTLLPLSPRSPATPPGPPAHASSSQSADRSIIRSDPRQRPGPVAVGTYVRALAQAAGHVVRSKHPCVVPGPGVYSDLAAERRCARMQAQLADACMHPSDNTTHTLYVSSKVLKLLQNGLSQRQRNAFWPGSVGLP